MASNKITVLARFKAREGKQDEARQALLSLVAPTRAEEGCINYDLHQSTDDGTRFMFYENWESRAALDNHLQMPYIGELQAKSEELFAEPVELTIWEMIS